MSFAQNQPITYDDMVAELNNKADERLPPCVLRGMGDLGETGYEDIKGEITYHKITETAGILAGNITFGDCKGLTNRFNLPLSVLRWLVSIPAPTETCFGSWSVEGLTSDKVTTLSGFGRVLRLTPTDISFERIYGLSASGGSTGAWPFSQFSNSRIHFQVVLV